MMRGFKVFKLEDGIHFEEKIQYVLLKVFKELNSKHIIKLDIFLALDDKEEYQSLIQYIKDSVHQIFQNKIPALTILPNNSQSDEGFVLKCQHIEKQDARVDFKKILDHHFVTIEYDNAKEIISGGIYFEEDNFIMSSQRSLDFAEQILMSENMNFGDIYKQNNYVSDINENDVSSYIQVQELFYDESLFKKGFPIISTTGTFLNGLVIDFQAIKSNEDLSFYMHHHSESNNSISGRFLNLQSKEIWISNCTGIQHKTIDIEKQTLNAFENLFDFIQEKNILNNNFVTLKNSNLKESIKMIDAFVHNNEDMPAVEDIINSVFPDIPKSIIHAPNRNKNVLVELESYISSETL